MRSLLHTHLLSSDVLVKRQHALQKFPTQDLRDTFPEGELPESPPNRLVHGSPSRPNVRVADLHVSQLSRKNRDVPGALARARSVCCQVTSCAQLPLGWWFLLSAEPDIHLLPQAVDGHRRRLSLCSLPVPKQLEESLGRTCLLRSVGNRRDLAVCASVILFYFRSRFLRGFASPLLCRDELAVLAIHGQQPGYYLAGHGQRRPVPVVASLHRLLMDQSQLRAQSWRQFGSFDQHLLDMFVALLRDGHAHHLIPRAVLVAAQPAVADRLPDGAEARDLPHLQSPVRSRLILSFSSGSRSRELTSAYSVFWHLWMVSRLSRSSGRMLSSISLLVAISRRKYPTLCSRLRLCSTPVSISRPETRFFVCAICRTSRWR